MLYKKSVIFAVQIKLLKKVEEGALKDISV